MKRAFAVLLAAAMLTIMLALPLSGCNKYTHIVITSQRLGDYYCSLYEDETVEIIKYLGEEETVLVPAGLNGRTVVGISTRAFMECATIKEVYLPSTLSSLPAKLFDTCENLESVYVPLSVTAIGKNLVSDCPAFTKILYAGTEAQWGAVSKGNMLVDNYTIANAEIVFGFVPEE